MLMHACTATTQPLLQLPFQELAAADKLRYKVALEAAEADQVATGGLQHLAVRDGGAGGQPRSGGESGSGGGSDGSSDGDSEGDSDDESDGGSGRGGRSF